MLKENRKYRAAEMHYAALTAMLNLIIFALTAIAAVSLYSLLARISEIISAVKVPLLTVLLIFVGVAAISAQTVADEQILRQLIEREATAGASVKYIENAVFASDALARPVILENVGDAATVQIKTVSAPRRHQILKIEVRRIVVAESKDFAYEYSDFTLNYDQPDSTHDGYAGSLLRVWRKTEGEWRVEAVFARQNR